MENGRLNTKEQLRKFVPIIRNYNTITTLIFMVSADHTDGSLRVCSHPLEGSIPTTVAAIYTYYDWTKYPNVSSNTGSSDTSTASYQAYEAEWDNWTQNNSPLANLVSPSWTIDTQATWYSNDTLPDDDAADVFKVNATKHRRDLCILDSGANRIVFNNESWLENTNSLPLTPTNTSIYDISGTIRASMQTIVGNSPMLISP